MSDWRTRLGETISSDEAARQEAQRRQDESAAQYRARRQTIIDHYDTVVLPALDELRAEFANHDRTVKVAPAFEGYPGPLIRVTVSRPQCNDMDLTLIARIGEHDTSFEVFDIDQGSHAKTISNSIQGLTKDVVLDEFVSRYQDSLTRRRW